MTLSLVRAANQSLRMVRDIMLRPSGEKIYSRPEVQIMFQNDISEIPTLSICSSVALENDALTYGHGFSGFVIKQYPEANRT